jgi:hypothetical protein
MFMLKGHGLKGCVGLFEMCDLKHKEGHFGNLSKDPGLKGMDSFYI